MKLSTEKWGGGGAWNAGKWNEDDPGKESLQRVGDYP